MMRIILYALTVLWITLKRILKNWRLVGALLAGLVLASGIMASVPIYTAGSLQKSFIQHWLEQDDTRPPFALILAHRNSRHKLNIDYRDLQDQRQFAVQALQRAVGQKPTNFSHFGRLGNDFFQPEGEGNPNLLTPRADLVYMSNLRELGDLITGRWYEEREDGVVEAVVDEATLEGMELLVGNRYTYWYSLRSGEPADREGGDFLTITVEIVGLFESKVGTTTQDWIYPPPFSRRLFAAPEVFNGYLLEERKLRAEAYDTLWVFDFNQVRVDYLAALIRDLESVEERANQMAPESELWWSPLAYFRAFRDRMNSISLFLLSLAVPTVGMVLYYVMLMAGLTVENRQSEITVLQSRGAGRFQVMSSFFLEWIILGLAALAVGPYLGLLISKIMGASTGFLSFVERKALPSVVNRRSYLYAFFASVAAVLAAVGPVFTTFRHSIVTLRQRQARGLKRSIWHRFYLDFIFLALAVFGYRSLQWESVRISPEATVVADPVLFFVPVIFLLGSGLLVLRLYPFLLMGFNWLTGRIRGVIWQLSFRRLMRNASQYVPLLLLLILTTALGIYTASSARTLSKNFEDRIRYEVGADLNLEEDWQPPEENPGMPGGGSTAAVYQGPIVSEPPFLLRKELPGVVEAARVLTGSVRAHKGSSSLGNLQLMAVEPHEFAKVAWYRNDLFPVHFYEYLRLLAEHREGALVSIGFYRYHELEPGDVLTLDFNGQPIEVYVVGVVAYWPTLNPYTRQFVIANLGHIQDNSMLVPYDVWYKLDSRQQVQDIVTKLEAQGIYVTKVHDAEAQIIEMKREPYRMGFFGILSMGFMVSSLITVLGFLIYTFYSIRSRLVQFGALRANGLSLFQLIAVVGLEQLATLGFGLGMGIGFGRLSTWLFLPFLRDRASEVQLVPPFLIITEMGDVNRIFVVIAAMFVTAVIILSLYLIRRRLFQALKLGEEV